MVRVGLDGEGGVRCWVEFSLSRRLSSDFCLWRRGDEQVDVLLTFFPRCVFCYQLANQAEESSCPAADWLN